MKKEKMQKIYKSIMLVLLTSAITFIITSISMYPMLIMDQGISYKDLITILIENAK